MRVFEEAGDISIIPGLFVVVRLDGRSFSRLTHETKKFEVPFDEIFHNAMVATTEHCMKCGFRAIFGYTQSDEISILLHADDNLFDRKSRKIISIFSGEASGFFSLKVGIPAAFDSRICVLPSQEVVTDYFRWRSEDANRNALNSYCYWTLRKEGMSVKSATE
ncbi:MAG: tRNA(His) guanylyltransferase Thg1 family protein, partial [Bacteroidota bacterium]